MDNIFQNSTLYLKAGQKSWTEKLHFSTVASILKISVGVFPAINRWDTNRHPSCSKTQGFFLLLKLNFYIIYLLCFRLRNIN
jgi:hypothetical protein